MPSQQPPHKSPKLPARRADVTAAGCARPRGFVLLRRLRLLPLLKPARRRSSSALGIPATLPRSGTTSGFLLLDGYTLGWAAKAAQTADTGATGVTGVLSVRSTCVLNKISIFPPCCVLGKLLHLPVIVLLKRRLNRSDGESQIAVAFTAILCCDHCRFCHEQTAFFE